MNTKMLKTNNKPNINQNNNTNKLKDTINIIDQSEKRIDNNISNNTTNNNIYPLREFNIEDNDDKQVYESKESYKELEFEFNKNWVNYDMIRLTIRKSLISKQYKIDLINKEPLFDEHDLSLIR